MEYVSSQEDYHIFLLLRLLLSMTIRLSINSALSGELNQIVPSFSFLDCGKKTMERVIGLESIVETKDLAVSQTKSHILRQNKLGFS